MPGGNICYQLKKPLARLYSISLFYIIVQSELSLKTVPCNFFIRSNSYTFLESLLTFIDFQFFSDKCAFYRPEWNRP